MYVPAENRYDQFEYRRCGKSGLMLPPLSLGLWHNFGNITPLDTQQKLLRTAFDHGITHFDLANNYGPPYGEAERNFGILYDRDWRPFRDELVISTKAGFDMWKGPYGDHGSRKYLMASLDQSLQRMHLDYVDIFYHHRPDPDTPIEETMEALHDIVKSGKALYVGISNYSAEQAKEAIRVLKGMGMHMLIDQQSYSMVNRTLDQGLGDVLEEDGVGCIAFRTLEGGLLSERYLNGIPKDSRAVHDPRFLHVSDITPERLAVLHRLNDVAQRRGQTLAQLSVAWAMRTPVVTSVLIGASRPEQITENLKALDNLHFDADELQEIDQILKDWK